MNTRYGFKITFTTFDNKRVKYKVSGVMPVPATTHDRIEHRKDDDGRHTEVLRTFASQEMAERVRLHELYAMMADGIQRSHQRMMFDGCLEWLRNSFGLSYAAVQRLIAGSPKGKRCPNGGNTYIYHITSHNRDVDTRLLCRVMLLCDMLSKVQLDIANILPTGLTTDTRLEDVLSCAPDITGAKGWKETLVWLDEVAPKH